MPLVSKSFSDIITFTRASSGTYFDATGTLQTATTNNARFDYNPSTLAARGMLVEEQRTNSIRNNTMVGAVAGTPGTMPTNWFTFTGVTGLTRQIVGIGTENGITYIEIKISGTPSAAGVYQIGFDGQNNIAALTGQTWAQSVYIKLQAGTYTGISASRVGFNEYSAVPAFVASNLVSITSSTNASLSTQRQIGVQTLNGGALTAFVQPFLEFTLTGAAIDITLRIGLTQLEQGAFATSVISTTTAAATRSADVASVNTLSPWYNASAGTLFVEFSRPSPAAQSFVSEISNNTFDEFIGIYTDTVPNLIAQIRDGGGSQANFTLVSGSGTANLTYKQAVAFALNDFAACSNGGAVGADTSGTLPSPSRLNIGNFNGSSQFTNGYLRRITYYPRRLSNAELQGITT